MHPSISTNISISVLNVDKSDEENSVGIDAFHSVRQKSQDSLSPATPIPNLKEEQIFEAATDYQNWTYKDVTLKNLGAFDHSTSFGITMDDENSNIREEIKKIVRFMNFSEHPLFESYGTLGDTSAAGFEDLHNIVDQISCNLEVVSHENACLALGHYVDESFYNAFKISRAQIRRRYLGKTSDITGHNPKVLRDDISNMQAYHALVDFIFHSLAWWLLRVAKRKSWCTAIIAVLARWSFKLKLIALDPTHWAEMCLIRGEETMKRISHDQKNENRITVKFPSKTGPAREVHFPDDRDLDYNYYYGKLHTRKILHLYVNRILSNLIVEKSRSTRSAAFEVRTLMCKGVLDSTLRHLTIRQTGDIEMSSDRVDLRCSSWALQLLLLNAQRIPDKGMTEAVRFQWYIKLTNGPDLDISSGTTERLDDIVSALIPLSLIGSSGLVKLLEDSSFQEYSDDEHPPAMPNLIPLDNYQKIEFSLSARQGRINTLGNFGTTMVPASRSPLITSMEGMQHLLCTTTIINKHD